MHSGKGGGLALKHCRAELPSYTMSARLQLPHHGGFAPLQVDPEVCICPASAQYVCVGVGFGRTENEVTYSEQL